MGVGFSSAIVIRGPSADADADVEDAGFWMDVSRKGLLDGGREPVEVDDRGAGSSKGEAGLLGSGDPVRLRKGLLLDRLRVKPGEGLSSRS